MTLPSTMSVIESRGTGGVEVLHLASRSLPHVAPEAVLIKVAAAGVNRADILQRKGLYPPPYGASDLLGLEVSGTVVAMGDKVNGFSIGQRVMALLEGGGYADFVSVSAGQVLPIPDSLSMTDAASLPEAIFTVWANLFESGRMAPGDHVLIHGGSSGIGSMALQCARAIGAIPLTTVGHRNKRDFCMSLGAEVVIVYTECDFVPAIGEATQGRGVDLILDMVGGDYVERNLSCLAQGGRHVSIATQKGRLVQVDLRHVMTKRAVLTGSTLRDRPAEEKSRLAAAVHQNILPLLVNGQIKPTVSHRFLLKNAADAHNLMESGEHRGKIVLEVSDVS